MDNGNGTHFSTLLSEFVYVRTYARWLDKEKRRETWPETVRRYVDYYVRNNPRLQNLTFDLAGQVEQAILNKDVMPSMRSLWCAGPAMDRDHTCGYNCLGAETPFITQSGVKRFSDFQNGDTVTVLTHSGAWKQAVVRSYGIQKLYKIQIVRGTSVQHVRATRNHQWLLADGSRTSDLRVSDRLERAPILVGSWVYEKSTPLERYYWALGYVYGDGTCVKGPQGEYTHSMVRLCGQDKSRFLDRFQELGFATSAPPTFNGDAIAYTGHYLKTLPSIEVDGYENLVAFVRGYLDADGAKNTNPGSPSPFRSLQSSNEAAIEFIRSVFPAVGAYISREEDLTGQQTNFGVRPKTVRFALTLGFGASPHCAYSVKSITEDSEEEVWCLEVEDDHSFVLPNGIVTGNCSFLPLDNLKAFAEALYILMCGTGVGFSVERTFIDCLPTVSPPTGESTSYVIEDSTEGWADSLHYALVEGHCGRKVWFDYSKIRPKGARLRIKGGTASGPEPLERVHNFVASILEKAAGRRLKPIEAHDIMCMIAEIVMVGGFRRASLISFSDPDDIEMRHAKDWRQGNVPAIRYMANNSAVWFERPSIERFREEWQNLVDSGSGERGFSIMNWDKRAPRGTTELRSNPCVTGDTRVLTASGYKMIQNFLGVQQGIVVDSRFGTEGVGHTTSHGAFKTGEREVFELTTQEGYKLKLTGDHRVMTPNGWVPADKLATGDKIHILNQGGGWGRSGSKELGAIAGWLAGDGCLLENGTAARLYFYGEKRELALRFVDYLNGGKLTTQDNQDRDYIDFKEAFQALEISSKTEVPNLVWEGTKTCQAAYLSALFSADGSIQGTQKKGISIRLSSVDLEHLRNVQLLLLNFGVYSKIYQNRQDAGYRMLPDGRGGLAEYACQAAHELVIANAGVQTYSTEIGFMLQRKAERLATVLSAFKRRPNTVKYLATVESLVSQGVQTVYDLTENTTHSFSANGIVVHNCHEIGLRFKRALNPWTGEGGGGQFCNLSATVVRPWDTQQTLAHKVRLATWLGCIQASYTHFPYLRPAWKQLCDEDRLLGVDLTGQCDNPELTNNEGVLTSLNAVARMTAAHASMALDIREPVAITCGKPSGNCRPWWSLTTTNRGLLTFRELMADHEDGQQWCEAKQSWVALRNDGTAHRVLRTYDNGMSKLVRLNMLYGLSVESTPEHRWFVKYRLVGRRQVAVNDWVAAKDIAVNDVLDVQLGVYNNTNSAALKATRSRAWGIAQSAKPIKMPTTMSEDLGWLLGYLWGDGALSPGGYRLRFTDENRFNLEKVQRILSELFDLEAPIRQHRPNCFNVEIASVQLWHWLVNNGVFKYAMDGSLDIIPQAVRASSRADIIAFIAGLIDSDGWAGAKRKREGLHSFTITTANSMFAKHLQDVAWSVGIGVGRSLNSLGKNLQTQKKMYLLGAVSQMLPEAFEVLLRNSNKLQRTATDASFVDWEWRAAERAYHVGRITAVEELAPEPTFDVEVDVDHWYFAGAVKSHNSSQLVDCASGFHPRYAPYYFRHVRVSAKDPLFKMIRDYGVPVFKENGQEHLPDDKVDVWVVRFPVKAPEGAMLRDHETALEQCERYLRIMRTWCGIKGHNQSATIYVRPDEWWPVGQWLYRHFDEVTGLSFLPHSDADTKYRLLPYQEITKEQYEAAVAELPHIDFKALKMYETDDEGEGASEPACVGGACEL